MQMMSYAEMYNHHDATWTLPQLHGHYSIYNMNKNMYIEHKDR